MTFLQRLKSLWIAFGDGLGKIKTVIIITVLFFGVIGPYALIFHLVKALKNLSTKNPPTTAWNKVNQPLTLTSIQNQF